MKKLLISLFTVLVLGCLISGCSEKKPSYVGTWEVTGARKDGSLFLKEEFSVIRYDSYQDSFIVFKEGGQAYLYGNGYGRLVDWAETENGIIIGGKNAFLSDKQLFYNTGLLELIFAKTSDSQMIPSKEKESSDSSEITNSLDSDNSNEPSLESHNSESQANESYTTHEEESSNDNSLMPFELSKVLDIPETGKAKLAEELDGAVTADEGDGKIAISVVAWNGGTNTITIRIDNLCGKDITTNGQPLQIIDGAEYLMSAFKNSSTAMKTIPNGKYVCITYIVIEECFSAETLEFNGKLRYKEGAGSDTFEYTLPIVFEDQEEGSSAEDGENSSVESSEIVEESQESQESQETQESQEVQEQESYSDTYIRPEFQTAMDEYIAFFEEYCEFMEKYNQSDNKVSMLVDYVSFMQQYSDSMQALSDIEGSEMTNAEKDLYLETLTKVNAMLLESEESN